MLTLSSSRQEFSIPNPVEVTVSRSRVAPAGGTVVALHVDPPGVFEIPTTITIPAGSYTARFNATGLAYGSATIVAESEDHVPAERLLTVEPVHVNSPPSMFVAPGQARPMTITLTEAAPVAGTALALQASPAGFVQVPASIEVPGGARSIEVTAQGLSEGNATITASVPGYEPGNTAVLVRDYRPSLGGGSPALVVTGDRRTMQVYLSHRAPAGGISFDVSVEDEALVEVSPRRITFPANQDTASIALTGIAAGTTNLVFESPGLNTTAIPVRVGEQYLEFSAPTAVVGHRLQSDELRIYRRIDESSYIAGSALVVHLGSEDPTRLELPATVTIPANASSAPVRIKGLATTDAPVPLTASAGPVSLREPATARVVPPELVFDDLPGAHEVDGPATRLQVRWVVPGSNSWQSAIEDHVFDLTIVEAEPEGLVPGFEDSNGNPISQVTIRAGSEASYWGDAWIGTPTAAGTYRVRAELPGSGSWMSAVQSVVKGWIRIDNEAYQWLGTMWLGRGLEDSVRLYVERDGEEVVIDSPWSLVFPIRRRERSDCPRRSVFPRA